MLNELILELVVKDIKKGVAFYCKYFDFKIDLTTPDDKNYKWIQLSKNNIKLMMQDFDETKKEIPNLSDNFRPSNIILLKYDSIDEINKIYNLLILDKVTIFMDMKETDYGALIFGVLDPNDNMIIVSAQK